MSAPAAPAKVCIHCGQDCSKKARTKDPQGRYACRECHERALAGVRGTAEASEPIGIEDDGAFAASLAAGVRAPEAPMQMCGSCGAMIAADAVVCTTCGFNRQTGRQLKVKQRSAKADAAMTAVSKAGTGTAALVFATLAGLVAGGVGAAVWAAIVYHTGFEVGYIAWGVGVIVGGAVYGVARGFAGMLTGGIAVAIALLSIAGGKYAAVSMVVDDHIGGAETFHYTDEMMQMGLALDVAEEFESSNKRVQWPAGMDADTAELPEHFPRPVWAEAMKRWEAIGPEERERLRQEQETMVRSMISEIKTTAKEEGFASMFDAFDILWAVLAIASAYSIGSGLKADE